VQIWWNRNRRGENVKTQSKANVSQSPWRWWKHTRVRVAYMTPARKRLQLSLKPCAGWRKALSSFFFFFSCRRAPVDDYKPPLINSKASVEDYLYVVLYAALGLQLAWALNRWYAYGRDVLLANQLPRILLRTPLSCKKSPPKRLTIFSLRKSKRWPTRKSTT